MLSDSSVNSQIDRFISILIKKATIVSVRSIPKIILEDPNDDVVLATVLAGKAEYIISGDKHLLKKACFRKTQIVSVNQFTQIIAKR